MLILDNALEFHDQLLTSGTIVLSGFCSVADSKFVDSFIKHKKKMLPTLKVVGKQLLPTPKQNTKTCCPWSEGWGNRPSHYLSPHPLATPMIVLHFVVVSETVTLLNYPAVFSGNHYGILRELTPYTDWRLEKDRLQRRPFPQ